MALYVDERLADRLEPISPRGLTRYQHGVYRASLVPTAWVGWKAFSAAMALPDKDIALLGIGAHRYFLFHSALGLAGLKWLLVRYQQATETSPYLAHHVVRRVAAGALGGASLAVGIHLLVDVFEPKAIIFPVVGSLFDGTLIDDRIWLLANSLWCFQIARDALVVALGDDYERLRAWVYRTFVHPFQVAGLASAQTAVDAPHRPHPAPASAPAPSAFASKLETTGRGTGWLVPDGPGVRKLWARGRLANLGVSWGQQSAAPGMRGSTPWGRILMV